MRPSVLVAVAVFAVVIVMNGVAAATIASLLGTSSFEQFGGFLSLILTTTASVLFAAIGAILVARVPTNRIAWLLLGIGVTFAIAFLGGALVARELMDPGSIPLATALEWASGGAWYLMVGIFWPQLLLLFPDGRLPSSRWRFVQVVQVAMIVLLGILCLAPPTQPMLPETVGVEALAPAAAVIERFGYPIALGLLCAGVAAMVVRFRRADEGGRAQLKWVAWVALIIALGFSGSALATVVSPGLGELIGSLTFIGIGLLPIAIGIAVLRYRLYEIDRLISRTIGWAIVTGVLVGAFVLLVLGLTWVVEPLTGGNTLAIAGSTLVVAALFQPLRSRVQRAVDRRFDRSRYDGERLIAAFGERLRDEVDLGAISADVLATVDAAVRPSAAGLWLRQRPGGGA
jgi:hypothetical protein